MMNNKNMGKKTYSWDTQYETAKSLMVHTFTDRVQVESNLKNGEVLVLVDGHTVNTYHNMPVREYEALLLGVEEYAHKLQRRDLIKVVVNKVAVCLLVAMAIVAALILKNGNI